MQTLTGLKFGRYSVGEFLGRNKHGDSLWRCLCDCGNIRVKNSNNLKTGNTKSCGCLRLKKDDKGKPPHLAPDGAAWIPLTQKRWCLVDKDDYELLVEHEWFYTGSGYACRNIWHYNLQSSRAIFLHRVVMGEPKGMQIDHRDGNRLDCRKQNLRICNPSQNAFNKAIRSDNRSGYKGVGRHSQNDCWTASICANGVRRRKSGFKDPKEAHALYCKWAKELFGEFARI